jgi:type II secretory pathway pseudopilin PulG
MQYYTQQQNKKGFTFIEMLLYMGIVSFILTAIVSFAWNIIYVDVKNNTQQELSTATRLISERLKYEIRNAQAIGASDFGDNLAQDESKTLSLLEKSPRDSTRFFVQNGKLFIQEDTATALAVQSDNTKITNLVFTDYSSGDNLTQQIGFTFTVEANYPDAGNRQEYQGSITAESSAEVRSH